MIVKSINMTVMKEEDPESGFSRERFLKAIEASEVKLNQKKTISPGERSQN